MLRYVQNSAAIVVGLHLLIMIPAIFFTKMVQLEEQDGVGLILDLMLGPLNAPSWFLADAIFPRPTFGFKILYLLFSTIQWLFVGGIVGVILHQIVQQFSRKNPQPKSEKT